MLINAQTRQVMKAVFICQVVATVAAEDAAASRCAINCFIAAWSGAEPYSGTHRLANPKP